MPVLFPEQIHAAAVGRAKRRILVSLLAVDGGLDRKSKPDTADISVNPGDFYGLEKIKMVMESFLWGEAFSHYGSPIGRLPASAAAWLKEKGLTQGDQNQRLTMIRPLLPENEFEFLEWLKNEQMNEQTRATIRHCADNLRALSSCRQCEARASFDASTAGFQARCSNCSASWRLWTEQGKRFAELTIDSSAARSFYSMGARHLRLRLP